MTHSQTAVDELDNADDIHDRQSFVDDINIPGFVDDLMFYDDVAFYDELSENETDMTRATAAPRSSSAAAAAVPAPDFDGAVISVFAIAVTLLVVGQVAIVCRQRHRRSCRRRYRKWNVPAFGQLHGLTTVSHRGGPSLHSPRPSEVWTALPSSHLSDLFHSDNYRTPAFAYINRRSTDSLPSTAAVASRTGSSGSEDSSTAAIFVRPGSSVTWSDVGEMTSSSPEKRPTTSLSSDVDEAAASNRLDVEAQTHDVQTTADDQPTTSTMPASSDAAFLATDDDVNVTSSASVSCSPTYSRRSAGDDDVDQCATVRDDLHRQRSFSVTVDHIRPRDDELGQTDGSSFTVGLDHSEQVSPSVSNSSTDVQYFELTTDCSIASTVQPDTDNSSC